MGTATENEKRIQLIVEAIVAKAVMKVIVVLVVVSFGWGAWATAMQLGILSLRKEVDVSEVRINDAAQWRGAASTAIEKHGWYLDNHEARISHIERKQ